MSRLPCVLADGRPMARRTSMSALLVLFAACAAARHCLSALGGSFVSGLSSRGLRPGIGQMHGGSVRRAFSFDIVQSEDHTGLVREEQDEGGIRISTHGGLMTGNYNTVLGNMELPTSGRSYWEVKIISKPSDAWEYIGVAEPSADVTVPLPRNRKGAGWFWGATWTESFIYTYMAMRPEFNQAVKKENEFLVKMVLESGCGFTEKETAAQVDEQRGKIFSGVPGTHVGTSPGLLPPFKSGMVIGVDADMDQGTLAFWADGQYLGPVRDETNKPLSIKGKKLVPAMSIYGRTTGGFNQYTVMELRTGLEPPPLPAS